MNGFLFFADNLKKSLNLGDVPNKSVARANLNLGAADAVTFARLTLLGAPAQPALILSPPAGETALRCQGPAVFPAVAGISTALDLDANPTYYAAMIFRSAGIAKWFLGQGPADGSENFALYNAARVENAIHINSATGVVTFPNVPVGGASGYFIGGLQVVGPRDTGWSGMAGTANKAGVYNTGTITLVQLAERVRAIQDALTAAGTIGP